MLIKEIAAKFKVSRQAVWSWQRQGCPVGGSEEELLQWLRRNRWDIWKRVVPGGAFYITQYNELLPKFLGVVENISLNVPPARLADFHKSFATVAWMLLAQLHPDWSPDNESRYEPDEQALLQLWVANTLRLRPEEAPAPSSPEPNSAGA